jgi:UDP-N-acetylglucosamine transferase subunit ALG13
MIFVAVGTHHQPFDRLLRAVDAAAAALGEEVVVQRGCSRLPLPHCRVVDVLPPDALSAHLAEARRVVLHGGSSLWLEARALGRVPIVVPRRRRHGEHVDDHQVEFAASLPPDEARVVEPDALLRTLRDWEEPRSAPRDRSAAFSRRLGEAVEALVRLRGRDHS